MMKTGTVKSRGNYSGAVKPPLQPAIFTTFLYRNFIVIRSWNLYFIDQDFPFLN